MSVWISSFVGELTSMEDEDDFEFLHQDAFDFEELDFVLGAEFLAARQIDVAIELLPALQMIFHLGGQLIVFFGCAHSWQWLLRCIIAVRLVKGI